MDAVVDVMLRGLFFRQSDFASRKNRVGRVLFWSTTYSTGCQISTAMLDEWQLKL